MAITVLVTGFGPFPGAPVNPTVMLVKRLSRLRRPVLADVMIVPHIFQTSYRAVDEDLPRLLARHQPEALLMFGLATRAKTMRVELRARNSLLLIADASGSVPPRRAIASNAAPTMKIRAPAQRLLAAIHAAGVRGVLSRDAGRYLCNYLCWRGVEVTKQTDGPRLAAFIHVPRIRGGNSHAKRLTINDLTRAGSGALAALAAAARR